MGAHPRRPPLPAHGAAAVRSARRTLRCPDKALCCDPPPTKQTRPAASCPLTFGSGWLASNHLYVSMQSCSRPTAWYASASHISESPPTVLLRPASSTARSKAATLSGYSPASYSALPASNQRASRARRAASSVLSSSARCAAEGGGEDGGGRAVGAEMLHACCWQLQGA